MRNFIKYLYKNSIIGYLLIHPVKFFYDIYRFHLIPEKIFIKRTFKKKLGYRLNLKNPKTFNEKIQWLKLNERTSLHTICADKLKVREYIKEKIGEEYLIPLVFETKNVKDINQNNLPDYPVIVKTNHDSGRPIVIKNKYNVDYKIIQKQLKRKLKRNYYYLGKEWEYKNISRRVIVDKLIVDNNGNNLLNDYKIHCFNGQPEYIQTLFNRGSDIKESWYDLEWKQQEFWYYSEDKKNVLQPNNLNKMIYVAKKLSKDFKYVRVDLYNVNDKIYFGELTFHPYSGFMQWRPKEWSRKLGDKLILNGMYNH